MKKIVGGILCGIVMLASMTTYAATNQLENDVQLNISWLDEYVNRSAIIRYVIDYFNNGSETAHNVRIGTSLPSYLRFLASDRDDIGDYNTQKVYDETDPCLIDLKNETGVYLDLLNQYAENEEYINVYELVTNEPDTAEIFAQDPFNNSFNMLGDFLAMALSTDGANVANSFYGMLSIDIEQEYPQCGVDAMIETSWDVGNLLSGIGGSITVYLQVLENGLYSTIDDHGTITNTQSINSPVDEDDIQDGPIYRTYTHNADQGSTTVFVTKQGVPELFSNQDILNEIIHDGMSEKEKAIALRQFVKDYTLNYPNPNSEQRYGSTLWPRLPDYSDPVRMLNTLYGMCGEINSTFISLATMAGMTGRVNGLEGHIPVEIMIDGNRAYMDADGGAYREDPNDGHIYSMSELEADPSIITNNPQDLNYDPEYYAGLIASTSDNFVGNIYAMSPTEQHTMAFMLYPNDVLTYGSYDLQQTPAKYYGEGTIKRVLGPDANVNGFTPDSFTFHESLPYLIVDTYIEVHGNIPEDVSVFLTIGANPGAEIPLGYLHQRLGYAINTSGRTENYYDYSLRFKCQSACDISSIANAISVTSSFTYNSLVLAHHGDIDFHILDSAAGLIGIDAKTEYNTDQKIAVTASMTMDETDAVIRNNNKTITLNATPTDAIILPATGALLSNIMQHRGYVDNDGDSLFDLPGRLARGATLDFHNTFTISDDIILSSVDAIVQVYLQSGLVLDPSGLCVGGSGGLLSPGYIYPEELAQILGDSDILSDDMVIAIRINNICEDISFQLSQPVKIRVQVNEVLGNTVTAMASSDGGTTRETIPATRISDYVVEIETTHFSLFTVSSTNTNAVSAGGGGGSLSTPKDHCPTGDFSASYYDGTCGTIPTTIVSSPIVVDDTIENIITGNNACTIDNQLLTAHKIALDLGITTIADACDADMYGPVIRKYLAKFLTVYAVKVLDMQPDKNRVCTFTDMDNESTESQFYAKTACQLGLMGLEKDGTPAKLFDPNGIVNRAQFGTVFSRLLFGNKYNIPMTDDRPRYQNHLNILNKTSVMTQIDKPFEPELRGYVMLMMMKVKTFLKK